MGGAVYFCWPDPINQSQVSCQILETKASRGSSLETSPTPNLQPSSRLTN